MKTNKQKRKNITISFLKQILLEHNINPTVQRIEILKYLYEKKKHPTIDMIFKDLRKKIPTLSKTTIYNTLKMFHKNGLAFIFSDDEAILRYDAAIEQHAHFKCIRCGKIFDLPYPENILEKGQQIGKVFYTNLIYEGICSECQKKIKR